MPTPSVGLQIKTPDTIRMSPRQFLRIGKVQKEHEEPLTEAQVKHRDRSYIISKLNKQLIALEKSFISEKGMYFGSWYKSLYSSSDPFNGYASWILPGLEYEIALNSSERLKEWDDRYTKAINSLNTKMRRLNEEIIK